MAKGIVEGMGGSVDFNIVNGYPFLVNEEKLTANVKQYAIDYLGIEGD